jgi:hypothetical protein
MRVARKASDIKAEIEQFHSSLASGLFLAVSRKPLNRNRLAARSETAGTRVALCVVLALFRGFADPQLEHGF